MRCPLVSILIPFKNTAQFLPECLASIRNQTYPHWEILAVDDHSTDESRHIVTTHSNTDARIKVFHNEEHGIIAALRLAYTYANGDFITRMDSDDIMKPNKLEVMVNSLLARGKGHVAVGQVHYFSYRGISDGYDRYEKWLNTLTKNGTNYSEIYKECVIPSPCWMTYKSDLERCHAFYTNRYPEDYDLTFRFYEHKLQCIPCHEVLHLWRDYDTRTSRTSGHYAQNYFLDIKLYYFLKLDRNPLRPLVIWGAGTKGKMIARKLKDQNITFHWLCDNPKKIGKKIYGIEMLHYTVLERILNPQSIITVANAGAQKFIRIYLSKTGQFSLKDYFFFC